MKDIKMLQYEKVREQYQKLIKLSSRQFSISDVNILRSNIITGTSELPLCGKYRVPANDSIDVKSMNAEFSLIKSDIESIFSYFSELEYKKREMEYIIDTYANYTSNKVKRANRDIMSLSSGRFINGITQELSFIDYIDESITTAGIADNKLSLPIAGNVATDHTFSAREISIGRIGPNYRVEVIGTPVNIFNPGSEEKLILRLYPGKQNTYQACGFKLDITAILKDINYIFIKMDEPRVGVHVMVETLSGNKTSQIYSQVTNSDTIDISFDRNTVDRVTAYFTMDIPNASSNGEQYYELIFHGFRIMNCIREQECQYVTTKISMENDIDYIQLVKEDEITGNGSVKYYLTTKTGTDNKPTAFTEILKNDDIFSLSSQKQQIPINPINDIWNLTRDISKGKRLYNILETVDDIDFGSIKVTNGQIILQSGEIELIPDSIKLYNGIGNYKIEINDNGDDFASTLLSYTTVYNSETGWITNIPLKINIDREPVSDIVYSGSTETSITTKYNISSYNRDAIKLYDSDNKIFDISISSITHNTIKLSGIIDNSNKLYIDYVTDLSAFMNKTPNIDLDYNSIYVSVDDIEYEINKDFILNTTDAIYSIELLKTGKYSNELDIAEENGNLFNESPDVKIKFKFRAYGISTKRTFTTMVYCNRYTDMMIIPFTAEEIAAGNYHSINGNNVSTERKYILVPGWNTIKTSQPYPTMFSNPFDVNIYTKKASSAGLIIPDDVDIIRPYMDSMRQISPFMLSVSNVDEKECFAYENGKVFLNYIPEFIDPGILNDIYYGNITGSRFLCKAATYDPDLNNTSYIPIPERFILELKYKQVSEERDVYVKIELSSAGTTGNVRVLKLGLNKFKED